MPPTSTGMSLPHSTYSAYFFKYTRQHEKERVVNIHNRNWAHTYSHTQDRFVNKEVSPFHCLAVLFFIVSFYHSANPITEFVSVMFVKMDPYTLTLRKSCKDANSPKAWTKWTELWKMKDNDVNSNLIFHLTYCAWRK